MKNEGKVWKQISDILSVQYFYPSKFYSRNNLGIIECSVCNEKKGLIKEVWNLGIGVMCTEEVEEDRQSHECFRSHEYCTN